MKGGGRKENKIKGLQNIKVKKKGYFTSTLGLWLRSLE